MVHAIRRRISRWKLSRGRKSDDDDDDGENDVEEEDEEDVGLSFQSWTRNRVRCSLGLRCQATAKGPPWESFDFLNNQMKGETRGPKGINIGYLRRRLNTICGYSWAGGENGGKHLEVGKLLCNGGNRRHFNYKNVPRTWKHFVKCIIRSVTFERELNRWSDTKPFFLLRYFLRQLWLQQHRVQCSVFTKMWSGDN